MTLVRDPAVPSGAAIALHFWSRRRRIVMLVLAVGVVAAIISLLIPSQYTAAVSILPDKQGSFSAGGLAQVAANFGVNINRSEGLTDLYPSMLTSERILGPILTRPLPTRAGTPGTLIQLWKLDDLDSATAFERGIKAFRQNAVVSNDKRTGISVLAVTLKDPVMAAAAANAMANDLDAFVRVFQRNQAQDRVRWIQTRIDQVLEELRRSETVLRDFTERNRILTSPDLQLQNRRLNRDVETNSAVYVELRRQMELAKIDEVKNIQVVQVLDTAHPPVKKSKPRRTVIVLGAMMATFLGAVGWNLAKMRLELDPSGDGAQVIARVRTDLLGRWKRDQLR